MHFTRRALIAVRWMKSSDDRVVVHPVTRDNSSHLLPCLLVPRSARKPAQIIFELGLLLRLTTRVVLWRFYIMHSPHILREVTQSNARKRC